MKRASATKSLSLTASMLLAITALKPSSLALVSGSRGSDDPASAPAPRGERLLLSSQLEILDISLLKLCACFANSWPNETG